MNLFRAVKDKAATTALDAVGKEFFNKVIADYGRLKSLRFEERTLKATLVLHGLEDRDIELACTSVEISDDGSSVSLRGFTSNMPFAEKALNAFAARTYPVESAAVRAALLMLRKTF